MKYSVLVLCALALSTLVVGCSRSEPATEVVVSSEPEAFSAMPEGAFATQSGSLNYSGYIGWYAEPREAGEYPGIVLIHEWWGLNENIKTTAERIASHGYRVIAVDLYDGAVATTSDEARSLTGSLDQERADANLAAAADYLRFEGSAKVATWGYCFGGGQSARFAVMGEPDATVVYYGNLGVPTENPEAVDAPVFLVFGEADTSTTVASAEALAAKLSDQGTPVDAAFYPKLGHAFANPSNAGHDPEATRDAWEQTLSFLSENLR